MIKSHDWLSQKLQQVDPSHGLLTTLALTIPQCSSVHIIALLDPPILNCRAILGLDPSPRLDAKAGHQESPPIPSDGTTPCTSMPSLPTISAPVRLNKLSLDNALPIDSTGSVVYH